MKKTKTIPFTIEAWKAGGKPIIRDGEEVKQLTNFETDEEMTAAEKTEWAAWEAAWETREAAWAAEFAAEFAAARAAAKEAQINHLKTMIK